MLHASELDTILSAALATAGYTPSLSFSIKVAAPLPPVLSASPDGITHPFHPSLYHFLFLS